jgi:methyltransferase-like protein 6
MPLQLLQFLPTCWYLPMLLRLRVLSCLWYVQVGCGVGNSVFPLIDINPQIQVYACDFSPTAVQLVRSHPQYTNSGRVKAFVADITADPLLEQLPGRVVDFCSMVFVLSAVAPEKMPQVCHPSRRMLLVAAAHWAKASLSHNLLLNAQ